VILTKDEVEKYFVGPQNTFSSKSDSTDNLYPAPSTSDHMLRMNQDHPELLGGALDAGRSPEKVYSEGSPDQKSFKNYVPIDDLKTGANGLSPAHLKETKIVNFGTPANPQWGLVQRVSVNIVGKGPQDGWVRADEIHSEGFAPTSANLSPDYETPINSPNYAAQQACPTTNLTDNLQRVARQIENQTRAKTAKDKANALELLESKLGTCFLNPKASVDQLIKKFTPYKSGSNLYEQLALSKMRSLFPRDSHGTSNLIKEDGQPVNEHDFIAMDTLARTLYGEMAQCDNQHEDSHYMEAVAKTILNRAFAANPTGMFSNFLSGHHDPSLNDNTYPDKIVKATTAPKQYSLWNTLDEATNPARQVSNLRQAFCPRSQGSSPEVANAWKRAMTTAIWAVMYPNDFKNYTADVKTFDYTSNLKRSEKNYSLSANPKIGGAVLSDKSCLMLWKEKAGHK
jgi:hypothetical protein